MIVRRTLAVLGGAAVALLAALTLGEYGFSGVAVVGSGVVTGLFVSEVTVSISRERSVLLCVIGALLSVAGMLGAAWASTGHRLGTVPTEGWVAVAAAAAAAALRARPLRATPDSPPDPPTPE